MAKFDMSIGVGLDLQAAYDRSIAMANAWWAFAETLRRSGRVCAHPEERQLEVGEFRMCAECDSVLESLEDDDDAPDQTSDL